MKFLRRGPKRVYADAAAATPVATRVKRRMMRLLELQGNPGGLHKEGVAAKEALEEARREVAQAIGAHADEIIFTGSGTEANNLALLGALYPLLRKNKHVHAITSTIEHQSVLEPLVHLKAYGLSLTMLPVDAQGLVSPKDLSEALTPQTALVSTQYVNSEMGVIQPLRDIAKMIRRERVDREESGNALPLIFHTDAAQAPLYLPVDVEKLGVDLMTLDAQKVLGPKGVGILYRRRGVDIEPVMFGGGQEAGLRPGTQSAYLCGAAAEALTLAGQDREKRTERVAGVRDIFIEKLHAALPDAVIHGSLERRIANNANISIPGLEGETAVIALDALGVAVATRSACAVRDEDPSHVILSLGVARERAREAIRITFLPDVTERDAQIIVEALVKARRLYGRP